MKLLKHEQETVINFNAADRVANVYTRDRSVMECLDSLVETDPKHYRLLSSTDIDRTYEMPKSYIRYRKPRSLSEKQRTEARNRINKVNNKRISKAITGGKEI